MTSKQLLHHNVQNAAREFQRAQAEATEARVLVQSWPFDIHTARLFDVTIRDSYPHRDGYVTIVLCFAGGEQMTRVRPESEVEVVRNLVEPGWFYDRRMNAIKAVQS